jgi:hypothetical protein
MSLASTRLHSLVSQLTHRYHQDFTFISEIPLDSVASPLSRRYPSRFYILCRASARSIPGFLGLKA